MDAITSGDSLKVELAVDESLPEDRRLDQQSLLDKLRQLIETRLTDKQKLAVRGLLEGLPVEEVARRTNSNRNAIYKLVHDARMKLRAGFEQAGIVAEDFNTIFA